NHRLASDLQGGSPFTYQPPQRVDLLPDYWQNGSAWVPPRRVTPPPADLPFTYQPSQRFDPIPDPGLYWWQARPRQVVEGLPAPPGDNPPTRQPSQRFDLLPDFAALWVSGTR